MTRVFTNAPHLGLGGVAILTGTCWHRDPGYRSCLNGCCA